MRVLVSVLCATGLVLVLAACAGGTGGGVLGASTTKGTGGATQTGASVCRGGTKVHMRVVNGPHGATLALVPVTIDGHGPYVFALDTGAAKSAIDSKTARRLHLRQVGTSHRVEGISGSAQAKIVAVDAWRLGTIRLRSDRIGSLDLFGGHNGPVGLLGSDVLSRFSSVCVDYDSATLRLGTRTSA